MLTAAVSVSGAYAFDFNNSQLPPGWNIAGGASFTITPCAAPSLDNTSFYWSSTSTSTPSIETSDLNVSSGGNLLFDFRFFPNSGVGPCETADQYNEGVVLEYSTNSGASWGLVVYLCPVPGGGPWDYVGGYPQTLLTVPAATTPGNGNGSCGIFSTWANYSIPIPPPAVTNSTRFRWRQPNSSGSCCDNWGLDNIMVNASPSVYYDWTSNAGFGLSQNILYNLQNDTCIVVATTDTSTGATCQDTVCIQVFDLPVPVLNYGNPICAGQQITFDGSQTTPIGGISNYQFDLNNDGTYEYSFANGVQSFSYFVIAGNYTVGYQVTTPGGCSAAQDYPVQVYANPTVDVSANPLEVCKGSPINLLAQSNIINPPSLPSTLTQFEWDFDNDNTTDATDAGTGTGTNKQSIQSNLFPDPGTYNVVVTVTSSGNCYASDSIQVIVNDLPVAGYSSSNVCFGTASNLMDTTVIIAPDFISTYSWDITNTTGFSYTNTSGNGDLQLGLDPGTYTGTLIVISDKGCIDTVTSTFEVFPQPTANFSYIMGCFQHNTFIDESFGGTDTLYLQWDLDGDGQSDSQLSTFEYVFSDSSDKMVTLTVTDANNCVSDTTIQVDVKGGVSDPPMPDVMSLTSAVGNDKLDFQVFAPGFNDCIDYTIAIFNRWGIKVYEAVNDVDNPDLNCNACFTGRTSTGSTLEPGTYYWVLRGSGNNGEYDVKNSGTLTIFN